MLQPIPCVLKLLKSHFFHSKRIGSWVGNETNPDRVNKNVRSAQGFDIVNKIAYNLNLTLSCGWL